MKAVLRAIGDDASATASRGSRLERAGISPASTRSSGAAMASAAGAEDAPVAPELLPPPLGLVALLGRSDLHPAVREALPTCMGSSSQLIAVSVDNTPPVQIKSKAARPSNSCMRKRKCRNSNDSCNLNAKCASA